MLLQIMLHSQIATENEDFTVHDVIEGIAAKLLRRHPHVFGDVKVETAEDVVLKWEAIKDEERGGDRPTFADVPAAMPALAYSQALQERAAGTGFEWPGVKDVLAKLSEEVGELAQAETPEQQREELGDVLWMLVGPRPQARPRRRGVAATGRAPLPRPLHGAGSADPGARTEAQRSQHRRDGVALAGDEARKRTAA